MPDLRTWQRLLYGRIKFNKIKIDEGKFLVDFYYFANFFTTATLADTLRFWECLCLLQLA